MNNYARLFTGQVGRDKYRYEPFEKPFPGIYLRVTLVESEIEEVLDLLETAKKGFPITKDMTREVIAEYARKKADVTIPIGTIAFIGEDHDMLVVDFYMKSAMGAPLFTETTRVSPLQEVLGDG